MSTSTRTWRKGISAPAPQPTSTTLDAGPRSGTAAAMPSRFCYMTCIRKVMISARFIERGTCCLLTHQHNWRHQPAPGALVGDTTHLPSPALSRGSAATSAPRLGRRSIWSASRCARRGWAAVAHAAAARAPVLQAQSPGLALGLLQHRTLCGGTH